jgi:O-antigen/teichoic acid export membrane protein
MISKKRIQSLIQNKDVKVLSTNFISLTLLKVAGYIFPLITLPYLSRVIGVDSFGELAFAGSIIVYFETITDFGFNYTATRDVAKIRDDKELVSKIFSNVFFAKLLLMTVSILILTIGIFSVPFLYEKRLLLIMTFFYIPGNILFSEWFFQAMENMKYITIINLFSKVLFTVLVFLVIKEKSDYIFQPLLNALGFLVSGIISQSIIFRKFNVRLKIPSLKDLWLTMKGSWNMFISLFLPNLYTNFSVILMRVYGGVSATGIYSSGSRFIYIFDQLSAVLSRTFYPFLARRIDKHSLYIKISGALSVIMCLTLFLGADLIIRIFYTAEFKSSATVIRIMAIAPFFLFLMNTYGPNYLVLIGKENILRNIILYCSIGGFALSWLIVSRFSYIGVSITIIAVWGVRGVLTWYYANMYKIKVSKNDKDSRRQ